MLVYRSGQGNHTQQNIGGNNMSKHDINTLLQMARDFVEQAEADAAQNPTSDFIQVVIVEPIKKPYKKTIPNTLEAMNDIVGGYIEVIPCGVTETKTQLILTCNEEGKLLDLPFNRRIVGYDLIAGTFFLGGANLKGDNVSLSDKICDDLIRLFTPIEVYL